MIDFELFLCRWLGGCFPFFDFFSRGSPVLFVVAGLGFDEIAF